MAQPQPAHPNLVGAFAPLQMECDAFDLVIEGEIPRDLCGTFYRNGPNPQFAPVGFISKTARCLTKIVGPEPRNG